MHLKRRFFVMDEVRGMFDSHHAEFNTNCSEVNFKSKRLPWETKSTQRTPNRRLGFIMSPHIQQYRLRGCISPQPPSHYENTPIQINRKFHLQKLKIFR